MLLDSTSGTLGLVGSDERVSGGFGSGEGGRAAPEYFFLRLCCVCYFSVTKLEGQMAAVSSSKII